MAENSHLLAQAQGRTGAPVAAGERIQALDFIRGLAVMGILAANIIVFGDLHAAYFWPKASLAGVGPYDDGLWLAQLVLIDGKMRGLFAILFGAGLVLFQDRAEAHADGATRLFRRLAWLLLFGLLHYFLVWQGDILALYAVSGLVAVLFIGLEARMLLLCGTLIYALGVVLIGEAFLPAHLVVDHGATPGSDPQTVRQAYLDGLARLLDHQSLHAGLISGESYSALVSHMISAHWSQPFEDMFYNLPESVGLMVIGMGLYRAGIFADQIERRWRVIAWAALATGTLLTLLAGLYGLWIGASYYAAAFTYMVLTPIPKLMVIIAAATLLAHWAKGINGWLSERVSAAGRAAFTNYLGTSILMLFVFHGWALGLFGKLNRPELYLVMVCIWAIMLAWSKPWLERYRYGPLEWLWRCLTYGKVFPLKR